MTPDRPRPQHRNRTAAAEPTPENINAVLARLQAELNRQPDNGFLWNEAGGLLFAAGQIDEAVRYFRRAVELDHRPPQAFRNLATALLKLGRPWQAMRWYPTLLQEGLLDAPLVKQIAEAFLAQHDRASAMDVLCRGRSILPAAAALDAPIEALRGQRAKIAFFWGGDGPSFLHEIIEDARRRYRVRLFDGKTARQVHELMQWSDISWFEWCTDLAVTASKLPKVCRTIVRLHRYEAYEPYPAMMRWENVDTLVTVGNAQVRKAMNGWAGNIARKTSVLRIPNGVNLETIPFHSRRPGTHLAFVGNLRMVKNPLLLLHCMAALKKQDPRYKLFIAGTMQDTLMQQTIEHAVCALGLGDAVVYEGFQKDICRWLADKQYLVSTSFIESQGMGILEAMACGIKPVIFNFPGAEEIYGAEYLFNTPDDFCRRICEPDYDSEKYRLFVERRYPLSRQLLQINELFAMFEKKPWTEHSAVPTEGFAALSALPV